SQTEHGRWSPAQVIRSCHACRLVAHDGRQCRGGGMANTATLRSRPRSAERSARARVLRMDAIGVVTAASMLVVVALWVHARGIQDLLGGGAVEFTSIGRLTGLVASDLLLIMVLLMARIP